MKMNTSTHPEILTMLRHIADHLTKQRAKSESRTHSCVYRSRNGHSCAVGCLIPDHLYSVEIEGRTVFELFDDPMHTQVADALRAWAPNVPIGQVEAALADAQAFHDGDLGSYSYAYLLTLNLDDDALRTAIEQALLP